jgi:hypothetical protein
MQRLLYTVVQEMSVEIQVAYPLAYFGEDVKANPTGAP